MLMPPVMQNLEKAIPDQPEQSTPVHLRDKQIFAHKWIQTWEKPYIPGQPEHESTKLFEKIRLQKLAEHEKSKSS